MRVCVHVSMRVVCVCVVRMRAPFLLVLMPSALSVSMQRLLRPRSDGVHCSYCCLLSALACNDTWQLLLSAGLPIKQFTITMRVGFALALALALAFAFKQVGWRRTRGLRGLHATTCLLALARYLPIEHLELANLSPRPCLSPPFAATAVCCLASLCSYCCLLSVVCPRFAPNFVNFLLVFVAGPG